MQWCEKPFSYTPGIPRASHSPLFIFSFTFLFTLCPFSILALLCASKQQKSLCCDLLLHTYTPHKAAIKCVSFILLPNTLSHSTCCLFSFIPFLTMRRLNFIFYKCLIRFPGLSISHAWPTVLSDNLLVFYCIEYI